MIHVGEAKEYSHEIVSKSINTALTPEMHKSKNTPENRGEVFSLLTPLADSKTELITLLLELQLPPLGAAILAS